MLNLWPPLFYFGAVAIEFFRVTFLELFREQIARHFVLVEEKPWLRGHYAGKLFYFAHSERFFEFKVNAMLLVVF